MARTEGKPGRLQHIRRIVADEDVRNQRQLRRALEAMNVVVDQSTLSRDLGELGIRKVDGLYRLVDPRERPEPARHLARVVRGWKACGPHLLVVQTDSGQAQAVAVAIEESRDPAIGGVLAGDDTIFLATTSRQQQEIALRRMERWFGVRYGKPD